MQSLFRHLRILLRLESTIIEMRLRTAIRSAVLLALAALIAVFGLGMLNVAAYVGLQPILGSLWAAIAAAGGDFVIAIIIVVIALAAKPTAEINTAIELRQAAVEGLETEFANLEGRFSFLSRLARNPLDTAIPTILVPLITAIIRALRKQQQG